MIQKIIAFVLLSAIYSLAAAAQIELTIQGKKQVILFDPHNKSDMEKILDLWQLSDGKSFYIYSDIGGFIMCKHPINDNSCKRVGNWAIGLSTQVPNSPELVDIKFDKNQWFPRDYHRDTWWIKMDDPHIVWPKQMQPITNWPIRYMMHYVPDETVEEPIKYKYDNYRRYQFDQDGFLLDNRTMNRYVYRSNTHTLMYRMFGYKDFVALMPVEQSTPQISFVVDGGDPAIAFQVSEQKRQPKIAYIDPGQGIPGDEIYAWASFDDPVQPLYDKKHGNLCVMDCKSRKRWAPSPFDARY